MTTKTTPKDKAAPDTPGESKPQDEALATASSSAPVAPAAAPAPSDSPEPELEPEPGPELGRYTVSGRSDVLHNGDLYREGDDIALSDADATPLLKRGHVTAKGR